MEPRLQSGIALFVGGFFAVLAGIWVLMRPTYQAGATKAEALVATDWGFLLAGAGMVALTLGGILIKNSVSQQR